MVQKEIEKKLKACGFEKDSANEDRFVFSDPKKIEVFFRHRYGRYGVSVEVSELDSHGIIGFVSFPILEIERFDVKKCMDAVVFYIANPDIIYYTRIPLFSKS